MFSTVNINERPIRKRKLVTELKTAEVLNSQPIKRRGRNMMQLQVACKGCSVVFWSDAMALRAMESQRGICCPGCRRERRRLKNVEGQRRRRQEAESSVSKLSQLQAKLAEMDDEKREKIIVLLRRHITACVKVDGKFDEERLAGALYDAMEVVRIEESSDDVLPLLAMKPQEEGFARRYEQYSAPRDPWFN